MGTPVDTALILLILTVSLTLVFDFINGFHDSANAIATVVSTKVLSPKAAVLMSSVLNLGGALVGTAVATTIGKGLVETSTITIGTILCTVIAAIAWNLITWYKGLPSSSSHALIGSLLGATVASGGNWDSIQFDQLIEKVIIPMVLSPVFGIIIGFIIMLALTWMVYKRPLGQTNSLFGRLQLLSAAFMALNHGQNDAQKSMGIIALALLLLNPTEAFQVPLWVKLACALAMCLGTMSGGWRIIRTLGSKVIKLQPIHGFAAETAASLIIAGASHFGIPLSTTHVISSSIMGVGAAKRFSAVHWSVVGTIVWAWVLTIPFTFLLAAIIMKAYGAAFE
ncbi:MAG: inorganic phosphate transporter [Bdellovibrionales bacterium]